ncbi:MAG: transglutaminase family protein [Microbacteriaceae bacterium]|nr:transglutaminase family protein [Microbacteriaceae bacterium]
MQRDVSARMVFDSAGSGNAVLAIAVAGLHVGTDDGPGAAAAVERLVVEQDGRPLDVRELPDGHGGRLHCFDWSAGEVTVEYSASVVGSLPAAHLDALDEIRYVRPSRYAESDRLRATALAEFGGLAEFTGLGGAGAELLVDAVVAWVRSRIDYVLGSSIGTHSALDTLLERRGVCRDFAHLTVALLRALDVPARVVSVYAPGLSPMDFHAVVEVAVGGAWHVVDPTGLAPRGALLRIATGRDAADTAFLTTHGANVGFRSLEIMATADHLPVDDGAALVVLH